MVLEFTGADRVFGITVLRAEITGLAFCFFCVQGAPVTTPDGEQDDADDLELKRRNLIRQWWCEIFTESDSLPRPGTFHEIVAALDEATSRIHRSCLNLEITFKRQRDEDDSVKGTISSLSSWMDESSVSDVSLPSMDSDATVWDDEDYHFQEQHEVLHSLEGMTRSECLNGMVTPGVELPGLEFYDDVPPAEEEVWAWKDGDLKFNV